MRVALGVMLDMRGVERMALQDHECRDGEADDTGACEADPPAEGGAEPADHEGGRGKADGASDDVGGDGAAHSVMRDPARKDREVGGMVDRVAEPREERFVA